MRIEHLILKNLISNEEFARKTLPFLKDEYFHDQNEKELFDAVNNYVTKYNAMPMKEALMIEIGKTAEDRFSDIITVLDEIGQAENKDTEWLVENTEQFCQDRAIHNAIMESIQILDESSDQSKGAIPDILSNALSVCFDNSVGHDYFEDALDRFDFYNNKVSHIPFDLHYMNEITSGGVVPKSLNMILAGTGVGKSLAMCHFAANNLTSGHNVLYITMEMAEERIAERIDANLLDVPITDVPSYGRKRFGDSISLLNKRTAGKLIIKEYPTATAGAGHFRHLINELRMKKNFKPDIIYIDYLNICKSSRFKDGSNVGSYFYIKAIAEELRGLAVEMNLPIISATQTTRSGFGNSDLTLEDTSESFGLPATCDLMWGMAQPTPEMVELNQILFIQLKNRYNDLNRYKKFVVGVDRSKMRLYDVEQDAQTEAEDPPVMNNSGFGQRQENDENSIRKRFDGFT
jgi:replicative DNA helicase